MNEYKVSVIIPTYNRSTLLQNTLNSLCNQTLSLNEFEVIVVDDGSNDLTYNVIKKYQNNLNLKYIFKKHDGFGVANSRNMGVDLSRGEIVIFLDCGMLCSRNYVQSHYFSHKKNPNSYILGYVYGYDDYNENKDIIKKYVNLKDIDFSIEKLEEMNVFDLREQYYKKYGTNLKKWKAPWVICWTTDISIERSIFVKYGGFDESYKTWGGEDTDLAIKLYLNNVQIILDKEIKSIHYPHEKAKVNMSKEELKKSTIEKRKYMFRKYKLKEISTWIYVDSSMDLEYVLTKMEKK